MKISSIRAIIFTALIILLSSTIASAYWVWTPETKKFLNPKYAVKDSPKEQYDWAMSFYDSKDYPRAITEFDKLTKSYEFSEYAGNAQYHIGLCYESMGKYYLAFQAYQKAIENFPHLDNVDEIIAREFNIANIYSAKENPKVLGTDIMTPTDRVVEIYRKIVDNAPYGKLADEALFNMGSVFKAAERYDEAIPAFQKILDEYPDSKFTERSRYEVAYCAYKSSLQPAYDQASTDKAIKAFSEFSVDNKDVQLTQEADKTILRLKDKAAEKSLQTAQFYEKIKKKESAIIYYQDILNRYPDCSYAGLAKTKIEELKSGKKRAKVVTAQAPKGGLFGLWDAKTPAVPPKEKEVKSAEVSGPMPKKWNWNPLNFGKKETPKPSPVPAPVTEETSPQVMAETPKQAEDPWAIQEDSQIAETQNPPPKSEPVVALAPVQSTPAAPVSAPLPSTEPAITEKVAAPQAEAPCQPATSYKPKKKGWNLADILGLGKDASSPKKETKAKPRAPDAPIVAEPLLDASQPAPSTDDPNLDKDDYIY